MGGTVYGDYMAVDLARFALKGLLTKTALDPKSIDYLYYGTVIQEPRTSNIAREASMGAGIPISVPSSTVTMACISSNLAITSGAEKILSGQADIIVAGTVALMLVLSVAMFSVYILQYLTPSLPFEQFLGGAETFSDVPIRFSKPIRKRLLGVAKASKKGIPGYLGLLKGLKLADLAPEAPAIANFTTGELLLSFIFVPCAKLAPALLSRQSKCLPSFLSSKTITITTTIQSQLQCTGEVMGHSSDRLAAKFGVSRKDQDEFTVMSHTRAAAAHAQGLYKVSILFCFEVSVLVFTVALRSFRMRTVVNSCNWVLY